MSDHGARGAEPMISVRDVTKTFKVQSVTGTGGGLGGGGTRDTVKHTALQNVSFDVGRGQTVGIIGHNGAGKSTLLKIVSGILQPSSGSVDVRGQITPILGLQAGFAPDLTGLENLYLKGAALGMTDQEVDARIDEIVGYARIGEAIHQPLRTYSSGMRMRLAFAITFLETPEVLIVDETVAVGDAVFRRKSMARIEEIKSRGATILLVSHGTHLMRGFCDRLLVMDRGELLLDAAPGPAIEAYEYLMTAAPDERDSVRRRIRQAPHTAGVDAAGAHEPPGAEARNGAGPSASGRSELGEDTAPVLEPETHQRPQGALIVDTRFLDDEWQIVRRVGEGHRAGVECRIAFLQPARDVSVQLALSSPSGGEVTELDLEPADERDAYIPGGEEVVFRGTLPAMPAGRYLASVDVFGSVGPDRHHLHGVGSLAQVIVGGTSSEPLSLSGGPLFFIDISRASDDRLRRALQQSLGKRLLAIQGNGSSNPIDAMDERTVPSDGVLYGYFDFGVHERLGAAPRYATVLRHPVERVLSWYRMQRSDPHLPYHDLASDSSLKRILEGCTVPECSNHMTALVAGRRPSARDDENTLQTAIGNLRYFEFITLNETLDADLHLLEPVVGSDLPGLEQAERPDGTAPDTDETLYAILRHNLLDLRLYELIWSLRGKMRGVEV